MKGFKWFAAIFMVCIICNTTWAAEPGRSSLKRTIKKEVNYPEFARSERVEGFVLVKYEVDANGSVSVKEMNASHEGLADYVRTRLEAISVESDMDHGIHFAKFTFRYV